MSSCCAWLWKAGPEANACGRREQQESSRADARPSPARPRACTLLELLKADVSVPRDSRGMREKAATSRREMELRPSRRQAAGLEPDSPGEPPQMGLTESLQGQQRSAGTRGWLVCPAPGVKAELRVTTASPTEATLWECCPDPGGGVGGPSWPERGILLRSSCVCGYSVPTAQGRGGPRPGTRCQHPRTPGWGQWEGEGLQAWPWPSPGRVGTASGNPAPGGTFCGFGFRPRQGA